MNPFRQKIIELADQAKKLHEKKREDSLASVEIVGELLRRNALGYLLMDQPALANRIGLTLDQFRKRAQAAQVLERFPEFRELLIKGETTISNLRLIAPKLTEANSRIFLEGIRGKSARKVSRLASEIDCAGKPLISAERRKAESLIEHALEVSRSRGRLLSREALMKEALELWLIEWDDSHATWYSSSGPTIGGPCHVA